MKKSFGGILMLLGTLVGVNSYAQKPAVVISDKPGWHKIGEITADFDMDTESISVLGADEFTAIKLKATDAPINIERLQVFYESGDMEEINVRSQINENAETSVINLKHPEGDIKKVTFTYKTAPNSKDEKAEIELYGLKTNHSDKSDAYREDSKELEKDIDHAADKTERDLEQAGDEMEREADEVGAEVEQGAEKAENKTKEVTKDVAADLKDEKVEGKESPTGETVYIDEDGKYYYIDNTGKKIFIAKEQLKGKPDNK